MLSINGIVSTIWGPFAGDNHQSVVFRAHNISARGRCAAVWHVLVHAKLWQSHALPVDVHSAQCAAIPQPSISKHMQKKRAKKNTDREQNSNNKKKKKLSVHSRENRWSAADVASRVTVWPYTLSVYFTWNQWQQNEHVCCCFKYNKKKSSST